MGARQAMPAGTVEQLSQWLRGATSKAEYQRIQCVWLRAALALPAPQIATALGWTPSHVRHVQAAYLRQGEAALRDKLKGGRHNAHLSADEERDLLAPFLAQAEAGHVATIAPVCQAYAERLGHAVDSSVAYRALHRHGWRTVVPRPTHPKADPAAREAFKKSCPT